MTREEIIEFLKANLKLNVWTDYDKNRTTISLELCGEEISQEEAYTVTRGNDNGE